MLDVLLGEFRVPLLPILMRREGIRGWFPVYVDTGRCAVPGVVVGKEQERSGTWRERKRRLNEGEKNARAHCSGDCVGGAEVHIELSESTVFQWVQRVKRRYYSEDASPRGSPPLLHDGLFFLFSSFGLG